MSAAGSLGRSDNVDTERMARFPEESNYEGNTDHVRFFRPRDQRPQFRQRYLAPAHGPFGSFSNQQYRFPPPQRNYEPAFQGRPRFWQPSFRNYPPVNRFTGSHGEQMVRPTSLDRSGQYPVRPPQGHWENSGTDVSQPPPSVAVPQTPARTASTPKTPEERLVEQRRQFKSDGTWNEILAMLSAVEEENPRGIGGIDKLRMLNGSESAEGALRNSIDTLAKACEELLAEEDRLLEQGCLLTEKLTELNTGLNKQGTGEAAPENS